MDDDGFMRISDEDRESERKTTEAVTESDKSKVSKEDLEEFRKNLGSKIENKNFKKEVVKRAMSEKEDLRRCFIAVIQTSPARFHDIDEKLFCGRTSGYRHLYKLISLGLVKKISIMDLWNKKGKDLDEEQKEIMKKFKEWTKAMKEGMRQYFGAKTNYFALTEFALDKELLDWTLRCELEMRESKKEIKESEPD
jgi:predicted transcriptional regulator